MAGVAVVRGVGMVAGFTLSNTSIVTADTTANHFVVIQRCNEWEPTGWWNVMANFAIIRGVRMIAWLTRGNTTIVTTHTTA